MYANILITALALAATTTATPLAVRQETSPAINPFPITLAQLAIPHQYSIVAFTPTRTAMVDACNTNVNATRTVNVQTMSSGYPSNPLCDHAFDLEGVTGLTLLCSDTAENGERASQVTAVATNGEKTHDCVELPLNVYPTSCGPPASIWQRFACQ